MSVTSDWVVHTYNILEAVGSIVASAFDMKPRMRGYFLAGEAPLLEPYTRVRKTPT
ncbi:CHASE3 domain-containing protein [Pseudophaeobacter sp.]|uniref:CHASE3 domain-containing protein n=1 Tax=Pseudophaeobacter sp. TaxID=1971739 RepID=UPI003A96C7FB